MVKKKDWNEESAYMGMNYVTVITTFLVDQ